MNMNIREGSVTELVGLISDKPSEYSFFDNSVVVRDMNNLRLWGGVAHWRPGALVDNRIAPNAAPGDVKPILVRRRCTFYSFPVTVDTRYKHSQGRKGKVC